MNFNYHIPTKILFGPGKLNDLAKEHLPWKKAMIVISSGNSMKKHGYLERVETIFRQKGMETVVFDEILPNPVKEHVMKGAQIARKENCDVVVGLGGGSSIDSAKSIAIMARNEGDYWEYIFGGSGKGRPVENGALPIIAITTTAGTGTEADPWTVITKTDTNEKIGFGLIPETFPVLSIVDPELMLSVPQTLTVYQAFDAFFHAAEGYIANIATPVSDIYALKSMELINTWLPVVFEDGSNLEARTQLALANTLSGFVESTSSCTSEHSMEHALSAYHSDLPHGAGLIMLSRAYFSFFAANIPDRFTNMAQAMGIEIHDLSDEKAAEAFIEALTDLQQKCGVHDLKMSDYGIKAEDMDMLARNAKETMGPLFALDRVHLSHEDTVAIFKNAYR